MVKKIFNKIQTDGLIMALKAVGRLIHHKLYQPDWDFEIVPAILERLIREKQDVTLVQIGANVGNTDSDQLYGFLKEQCKNAKKSMPSKCRAVMVEPVRHLFEQLSANYTDFPHVACENVAIAEVACMRNFYRLREGIDLEANGLPPWSEQLGSFLPEKMNSLWGHEPENQTLRKFVEANVVVDSVKCISIHDLLEKHQLNVVDLLQIDTEGYDYQILRTIDFKKIAPRYINYERIHLKKEESLCRTLLLSHGYRLHDHGQDTLCEFRPGQFFLKFWRERVYCAWLDCIY